MFSGALWIINHVPLDSGMNNNSGWILKSRYLSTKHKWTKTHLRCLLYSIRGAWQKFTLFPGPEPIKEPLTCGLNLQNTGLPKLI